MATKPSADLVLAKISAGDFAGANAEATALLAAHPNDAKLWHLKGAALVKLGDLAAAVGCFNRALQLRPDFKEACFDLAMTLDRMGKFDLAVKAYKHWLKIEQSQGGGALKTLSTQETQTLEHWFFTGEALQKKGDSGGAAAAYRKVLGIQPDMPEALTNLGNALYYLQQYKECEQKLLRCLRVKPGHADALNTLGTLYKSTGHYARAIAAYRQALEHQPEYLPSLINLSNIHYEMKRYDEAIVLYKQILAITPGNGDIMCHLLHLLYRFCDWEGTEALKAKMRQSIREAGEPMAPLIIDTVFDSAELQLANARLYSAKIYPAGKPYAQAAMQPRDILRIGYLSADFFDHATMHLMGELFELHDKERFEIYAYSYGVPDASAFSSRAQSSVERFCDIRELSDSDAADTIRRDAIDILVDLKGYTKGQRLGILASRPAPLQLHYLGFPGTTGASFIDYFITDPVASPHGAEAGFSEQLIRLPYSYQINDRKRPVPDSALPRSAYGLPEEGFVFCDFNNSYKIMPDIFAVWMRLLEAVEGSVLWLYETHPEATNNLRKEAVRQGIDTARLIFATVLPQAQHLPRYLHADLVLDTFPTGGHTTTSDALWGGAPVLAMAGETFVSRVAASLLYAVELPELVVKNLEAYEALALELARDRDRLAGYRRHLTEGRMRFALFDSLATTRALEAAYMHMAERRRQGLSVQGFSVSPDLTIRQDISAAS